MKKKNIMLCGLLAAFSLLMLSACGDKEQKVTEEHLKDRTFVMQSIDGQEIPMMLGGAEMTFDGDMLMSANLCNRLRGKAKIVDGKLVVTDMSATKMACPEEIMQLENTFMNMVQQGSHILVKDDLLTMTPSGEADTPKIIFMLKPEPK